MRERAKDGAISDKRLLSIEDAGMYLSLGTCTARVFCQEVGAIRKIGRRVFVDKKVLDEAIDKMEAV